MDKTYLTDILSYNPDDGIFRWKKSRQKIKVGDVAGNSHKNKKYVYIQIDGKSYSAHRLAWIYMTGLNSKNQIDHINGNKKDNRFCNLREATHGQNRANSKTTNKFGLKGVRKLKWVKDGKKCWIAQITFEKKTKYLGSYFTIEEAHQAYCDAAKIFHGKFAKI